MVKTALRDTYIGGTNPKSLQNEVSTCRQIYFNNKTWVVVNQSVYKFNNWFLLEIDELSQY